MTILNLNICDFATAYTFDLPNGAATKLDNAYVVSLYDIFMSGSYEQFATYVKNKNFDGVIVNENGAVTLFRMF